MQKFALSVAAGVVGLALIAGAATSVFAEQGGGGSPPADSIGCYYHGFFCSYPGDNYWSECNPNFGEGWIATSSAKVICEHYHAS